MWIRLAVLVVVLGACGRHLPPARPLDGLAVHSPPAKLDLVPQVFADGVWTRIAVSNDGRLAMIGEDSGLVHVVDIAQGKILQTFGVHAASIRELVIAPDRKRAASADTDGVICTFDLETVRLRACRKKDKLYRNAVGDHRIALSPDATRVVTAKPLKLQCALSYYCEWRYDVFDLESGAFLHAADGETTPWHLAFTADGKRYGWVAYDGVHLRDAATGRKAGHYKRVIDDDEANFTFAADAAAISTQHGALVQFRDDGRARTITPPRSPASTDSRWWAMYFIKPTAIVGLHRNQAVWVGVHAAYMLDFDRGSMDKIPGIEAEVVGASPDGSHVVLGDAAHGTLVVRETATGRRTDLTLAKAELYSGVITPENVVVIGSRWGLLRLDLASGVVSTLHIGEAVMRIAASGKTLLTRGELKIIEDKVRPDFSNFTGQRTFHHRAVSGDRTVVTTKQLGKEFIPTMSEEPPAPELPCDLPEGCAVRPPGKLDTKRGHRGDIVATSVSRDGKHALTVGVDGTAKLWNVATGAAMTITTVSEREWLIYDDTGVFDSSRYGARLVAAVDGYRTFAIDQLAMMNNRPDVLFERVGIANADTIRYFKSRHEARKGAGAGATLADALAAAPTAKLEAVALDGDTLAVKLTLESKAAPLASYQIWVNQVPVFFGRGTAVSGHRTTIEQRIPAGPGANVVEVAALSERGVESVRALHSVGRAASPVGDLYFVGIGVSSYRDRSFNLEYAAKDAGDLAAIFQRLEGRGFRRVYTHVLRDREATASAIGEAQKLVAGATVNDTVVVFVAGHGTHSRDNAAEYLFVTHDYDPQRERETTAPFAAIEGLLANSAARRRLLLVDTCESGDRDNEVAEAAPPPAGIQARTSRALVRIHRETGAPELRVPRPFVLDRDRLILTNLGLGTGTVVLAASRWNESSYESARWDNGVFTAELKRALTSAVADANADGAISIEELARYLTPAVAAQTDELQHPMLSQDNPTAGLTLPIAN